MSLTGGEAALAHAIVSVVGTTTDPNLPLVRAALAAESDATKHQPGIRGEVAVAVTPSAPLNVAWDAPASDLGLPLGSGLLAPIKVARAPLASGAVRLSMVTSQVTPKKEVVGKDMKKRQVDDVDRTLRLDGSPKIDAKEAQTVAKILIPADLAGIPYDVAFKAELLAADNKTVVASAVTPARRMIPVQPLRIELAGEAKVEAKAGTATPAV